MYQTKACEDFHVRFSPRLPRVLLANLDELYQSAHINNELAHRTGTVKANFFKMKNLCVQCIGTTIAYRLVKCGMFIQFSSMSSKLGF